MCAKMISASINLSKVDKSKITVSKKGDKYLNLTIIVNNEKNQYDQDVSICIEQGKEERQRGDKKVYVGNGKTFWCSDPDKMPVAKDGAPAATGTGYSVDDQIARGGKTDKDDLPF